VLVQLILLTATLLFPSDAFDTEKLLCVMEKLRHGQAVDIPNYDFKSYKNNVFPARRVQLSYLWGPGGIILHITAIFCAKTHCRYLGDIFFFVVFHPRFPSNQYI
jgi:hypothetical protein